MRGKVLQGIGIVLILVFISAMDSEGIGYILALIGLIIGLISFLFGMVLENVDEGRKESIEHCKEIRRKSKNGWDAA